MTGIKIEKGVPLPSSGSGRPVGGNKYPLREMEIGDSFFAPGMTPTNIGGSLARLRPKHFSSRTVVEDGVKGVRVWRVK